MKMSSTRQTIWCEKQDVRTERWWTRWPEFRNDSVPIRYMIVTERNNHVRSGFEYDVFVCIAKKTLIIYGEFKCELHFSSLGMDERREYTRGGGVWKGGESVDRPWSAIHRSSLNVLFNWHQTTSNSHQKTTQDQHRDISDQAIIKILIVTLPLRVTIYSVVWKRYHEFRRNIFSFLSINSEMNASNILNKCFLGIAASDASEFQKFQ